MTVEGRNGRERAIVELLTWYRDLADPAQSGNGGTEGLGGLSMPLTYTPSVAELERLLVVMREGHRSIWWHTFQYFVGCTVKNQDVWVKRRAKNGKSLSVQERRIVTVRDPAVRLEKVRRGVTWLAGAWGLPHEPFVPAQIREEAA